jgi:hypothetical protein
MLVDHRADALEQVQQPAEANSALSSGAITPWATWLMRDPSTLIRPQPVRRRPGIKPQDPDRECDSRSSCVLAPSPVSRSQEKPRLP